MSKISSMHFYAWKQGLKTGMYYLRSRAAVDAIKFTLNVEELLKASDGNDINSIMKVLNTANSDNKDGDAKANGTTESKVKEEEEGCISCSG